MPGTCWVFGQHRVWIPLFAPFPDICSTTGPPSSWQALPCWLQQPIIVSGSSWKGRGGAGGGGSKRGGDSLSDCRPTLKASWGILATATGAPISLPWTPPDSGPSQPRPRFCRRQEEQHGCLVLCLQGFMASLRLPGFCKISLPFQPLPS